MSDSKRRTFLAAAGAGAAAGTVALTAGPAAAAAVRGKRAAEPVVAHIADPRSDELTLMLGEREVVVRDRDLVDRILAAAGGE